MLAELASRKETPALAARAAAALAELTEQRSAQALMELEALGARVNRGQSVFGFVVIDSQPLVEIGESFKGGVMDLARLKWLADVPVVVLSGPRVTDQWLKPALATPGLEQLHLYRTHVSVAGLNELAGHASLKQIGLYYMPIGDEALAALAKLPLLNYVKLYGTQISSNRVQNFTRDSGISVDYRRGAFLGVGCNDLNGICQISRVHAGSPAERAGLRAQDYIVRFGGTKVTNFESLQTLIGARDIDDEVEIEVIRPASDDGNQYQPLPLKVKLAPWDVEAAVQNPRR
jgi:membrane-associated protease RseP (regulator of RpoE activity)